MKQTLLCSDVLVFKASICDLRWLRLIVLIFKENTKQFS